MEIYNVQFNELKLKFANKFLSSFLIEMSLYFYFIVWLIYELLQFFTYCKLNELKASLNVGLFLFFLSYIIFSCKVKSVHWTIPYCCFNFKLSSVITFTLCRKIIALTQLRLKLQVQICEGKENIVMPYCDLVLNSNVTILTALWLYIYVYSTPRFRMMQYIFYFSWIQLDYNESFYNLQMFLSW